ncbi:MAG TPA: ACT domain-containing protein, partial [Xanthomonadaceae bacterium]|nr:ACT domain-containing protein [Xanthomonadaceae bacterium]
HSPDRDGLFAAIVATLDRAGLAIQQARLLDGPGATVFDTFEVLPAEGRAAVAADEVEQRLAATLALPDLDAVRPARRAQPRHLRHFRRVPQVAFGDGGRRTVLSLVCTDRPGLLADVTRVLRARRLRVHDARIATFGERAEDVFRITDERERPLDEPQQQALRDALLACLDGETA